MRVAIAGVGLRTVKVLKYLRQSIPDMALVGYVDPSPALLHELCDPADINAYDTIGDMLKKTAADILFVASPNHLHLEHIEAGLRAGVRVFTEKPVVATAEETWQLAELLKEYGPDQVLVGLVLRYAPQVIDFKQALDNGILGDIISLEANEHIEPAHGAFFMRDWRRYSRYSGGFLMEKCVHDFDFYNLITGSRPQRVASFGGRRLFVPANASTDPAVKAIYQEKQCLWESTDDAFHSDGDIVDHQTAILSFESGATLAFHTNTHVPDKHRRFMVVGTKGTAEGDFERGYLKINESPSGKVYRNEDYTKTPEAMIDHYGADAQMAKDIAAYLDGGTERLPVSIVDALEAGLCALALDEARLSGTIVDLTEQWARLDAYGLRNAQ